MGSERTRNWMKIAVIGAGVCGLSAARALCSRGHSVVLHEQFELFHDRGSSHGASRIVRRAYPDAFYTACMAEAYPMWHDLEAASGKRLLHECGLLFFGPSDSPNLKSMAAGLSSLDVPFSSLDATQTVDLLPELRLGKDEIAIWTPEAGWVDAALALRTIFELACADGLITKTGAQANPLELAADNDVVIVAAGAWTPRFASISVRVTLQTYAYVEAQVAGPVWIEDSVEFAYGFPSTSLGLKLGIHGAGESIDPAFPGREPSKEVQDFIRQTADRRFGIADPVLREPKGCLYTTTKTEDFLLGRLAPNVFFASACSGHGFKMGPWIGKLLADFAEGKDTPERHKRFFWSADAPSA